MALTLKTNLTLNQAGTELYIEFLNATGVYNVTTNPGGFGSPNPARNTLAIIGLFVHKNSSGDVLASVLPHDPLTVTSFTVLMSKEVNGVLDCNLFAVPIFNPGGTYVDGDVVYDNQNPISPFLKKRVSGVWEVITSAGLLSTTVVQLNSKKMIVPDAIKLKNKLKAKKLVTLVDFKNNRTGQRELEEISKHESFVELNLRVAVDSDFCSRSYNQAQIKIEAIFDYYEKVIRPNE